MTIWDLPVGEWFRFSPREGLRCSCVYQKIENTTIRGENVVRTTTCRHYEIGDDPTFVWFSLREVIPAGLMNALQRLE